MRLAAIQPDGSTLREHLQAAAAAGAGVDALLQRRLSPACRALWNVFAELSATRPAGMQHGAVPHSEILAWQQLSRVSLTPWEVDTLLAMDRAALAAANKRH
jgi:hypothetical protein